MKHTSALTSCLLSNFVEFCAMVDKMDAQTLSYVKNAFKGFDNVPMPLAQYISYDMESKIGYFETV